MTFKSKHHSDESKKKMSETKKKIFIGVGNPFYGKHHTDATKQKLQEANSGRKMPDHVKKILVASHVGKPLSDEHKSKLRKSKLGTKMSEEAKLKMRKTKRQMYKNGELKLCKLNNDPEFQKKVHLAANLKPNKPESKLIKLFKQHNLPYKYTGDGAFWIENLNPDFVNCNGQKKCVELFGDYWHNPLLRKGLRWNRTQKGREALLKKYGWKLLVIWEHELNNMDAVINKLNNFNSL